MRGAKRLSAGIIRGAHEERSDEATINLRGEVGVIVLSEVEEEGGKLGLKGRRLRASGVIGSRKLGKLLGRRRVLLGRFNW